MQKTVELPRLGESMEKGVIVEWLKSPGDKVEEGDALVLIEVDKVDTEIPSPVGGSLAEVLVDQGDEVAVGTPICVIES